MKLSPILFIAFISFYSVQSKAQSGCTDPEATNFDPLAKTNDGSCVYPITNNSPILRANLGIAINETSGLVLTDGQLWTHQDSGGPNALFKIDSTSGLVKQIVYVDNYSNVDWEDIAADKDYIYIAETGNNNGTRKDLKILKIAKADIGSADTVHLNAQAIQFNYADQTTFTSSTNHNFDCEAIIAVEDSIYLFTKNWGNLQTKIYRISKNPGIYTIDSIAGFNCSGLICGADYNPAKKEVMLIGYNGIGLSFLWSLNDYHGNHFTSGNKRRIELNYPKIWQTEGIAFVNETHLFISSESILANPAGLFSIDKNWAKTTHINYTPNIQDDIKIYPNPSLSILNIENLPSPSCHFEIKNIMGQVMTSRTIVKENTSLNIEYLASGIYTIYFINNSRIIRHFLFTKH